jgi:hypothetical protein
MLLENSRTKSREFLCIGPTVALREGAGTMGVGLLRASFGADLTFPGGLPWP